MDAETRALTLHTLRGDIQQIGMETDYNRLGIRKILEDRYVRRTNSCIMQDDFDSTLDQEYAKVKAWRKRKMNGGE